MHYNISGTSEIIGILIDQEVGLSQKKNLPYFAYPFYNKLQLLFGATQASGKSINWFINNFMGKNKDPNKIIFKNSNNDFAKKDPLIFLPYTEGERSPLWDPNTRGIFFGLSHQQTKNNLYKAVLEGVGFSILHNFETLQIFSSQKELMFEALRISGGGAKNDHLNQIKANILGKKVITTKVSESGLLGGAILAMVGLGIYSFDDAVKEMVHTDKIFQPNMDKHYHYYAHLFPIYKNLYRYNKELFKELRKI